MPYVVRFLSTALLACAFLLAAPSAYAVDSGDIVVVSSKGEVRITVNGAERNLRAGGVLELPASVRTGRDGNVELRQGATTVSVGPETLLEFPALEKRGAPIDRIVQPRGNAFYNIGKREGRKLRVETPYLVGVIKGTQFNVASQDEATTISLFEGLLEVRATDDSDVVDLKAGEIASRKRGDKSISIIKMDAGKAPPTSSRPTQGGGSNGGAPGPAVRPDTPGNGETVVIDRGPISVRPGAGLSVDVRPGGSLVETGAAATVNVGQGLNATTGVVVNASDAGVNVGADTSVSLLNAADVAANAAVNLGPAGIDVVTNVAVDAGPAAADLGVTAAVDVAAGTVDVTTAVDVGAGPVTADLGTDTSVDLGAGTIDTSASAAVDAGPLTTDLAAGAAVDLTSPTVDTAIDVGVDVAGADIDLGAAVPVVETVTDTVVDVGGLLDGLLRRPGSK